ncbi:hypothetical protein BGW37DRAFT_553350 [Umbelopsis sp. PMI_123]|nr:hypothetical protein BGW37DRAFT_553350 [Umbelopsis sp. PMI_123]
MLRIHCNGNINRWDDFVDTALFATRIRTHGVMGKSPFYLTYGREPVLPGDSLIPFVDRRFTNDPRIVAERNAKDLFKLGQIRASIEWKQGGLEIGDHVRMHKENKLGLEPNWVGPDVVLDKNDENHVYKLEHILGEQYDSWVPVDRLRKIDPYSIDAHFYSPATIRERWVTENSLPQDNHASQEEDVDRGRS